MGELWILICVIVAVSFGMVIVDVRGNVRMKCKDGCMYLMKDKKYMVSFERAWMCQRGKKTLLSLTLV